VLFYGQFIPLHGIDTVVRAAKLTETDGILWHLIGTGQEVGRIRRLVAELKPANLEWKHWVPYEELVQEIHSADVCLGIFGATEKAARVIPNKVFQVLASEKPLITADTPAVRELGLAASGVYLVPAGEPWALAKTLRRIRALGVREALPRTSGGIRTQLRPAVVVEPLVEWLREQLRFQSRRKEQ
jgi:glycosyltransferase involved in cell wall biosynthesis